MSTLVTIQQCTAFHLPAPGVAPVPLATGDLALTLLPAEPPTRPNDKLTITIGHSAFVIAKNSPVQRTKSLNEHPSFVFTPEPPEGGQSIGQVRIDLKDSPNPDAWEAAEQACKTLEAELRAHGVWADKMLFVDDEYETDGPVTGPVQGWGESFASTVLGGASSLVSLLTGKAAAQPGLPTANPHAGGTYVPQSTAAAGQAPESASQDLRAMATDGWTQATIAAKGFGEAAVAVGGALGQQAKHAVEGLSSPASAHPTEGVHASGAPVTATPPAAPEVLAAAPAPKADAPAAEVKPAAAPAT